MTTKTLKAFNKKRKSGDNFFAEEEPMDLPEEEKKGEDIDDEMEVREVREDFPIHNKWEDEEEII